MMEHYYSLKEAMKNRKLQIKLLTIQKKVEKGHKLSTKEIKLLEVKFCWSIELLKETFGLEKPKTEKKMNFLGKIFKKKETKNARLSSMIKKINELEDNLYRKQIFLEEKIEKEKNIAVSNKNKNKKAAIQALRRKKRYERQLQLLEGAFSTIETNRSLLEKAQTNNWAIESITTTDKALKFAHKNLTLEEVDNLLEQLEKENEVVSDVSNALCPSSADELDDDIAKELQQLELENAMGKMNLPDHPKDEISIKNKNEKLKEKKGIAAL